MRTQSSEAGFSLLELLVATAISLAVIGTAMTTFKDAVAMSETATNQADASQNLRSGTNFLVRDLVSAGRLIPTGGISIPSGANSGPIKRPSPPLLSYTFNNTTATTLTAVVTGQNKGPMVDSQGTDMVTILWIDPILDDCLGNALQVQPAGTAGNVPVLAAGGVSFSVGTNVGCVGITGTWLTGSGADGQAPVQKGDLILFTDPNGKNAIQTVTKTDATNVYFEANTSDTFGFNQRSAAAGSITQILGPALTAQRVLMYTYYVDATVMGAPHLMRQLNNYTPQALAGIVEDLQLTYDIVDGAVNPTDVVDLPYTLNGTTYSANQIRKVNVHVGVRSEAMSTRTHDYLRSHMSTVVSLRSLAFVDRYK